MILFVAGCVAGCFASLVLVYVTVCFSYNHVLDMLSKGLQTMNTDREHYANRYSEVDSQLHAIRKSINKIEITNSEVAAILSDGFNEIIAELMENSTFQRDAFAKLEKDEAEKVDDHLTISGGILPHDALDLPDFTPDEFFDEGYFNSK